MPRGLSEERVFPAAGKSLPKGIIAVWRREVVEDDGSRREQYIWKRGTFVVVVALDPAGNFVLKREFKYARMEEVLTFATGAIRPDEVVIGAASRELREEFGMAARRLELLTEIPFVSSPDKSTELHYVVLATNATPVAGALREPGEVVLIPKGKMLERFPPDFRIAMQRLAFWEAARYLQIV